MLQVIREKSQGWFAWTVVSLICITFALFGIQLLFELLSIESSILYTVLFLIVGVAMLFGARQLSEKLINEK